MACFCPRRTHGSIHSELPTPATNATSLFQGLGNCLAQTFNKILIAPLQAAYNFINAQPKDASTTLICYPVNTLKTLIYLLSPLGVGVATAYIPAGNYAYSLMGASVASNIALLVNTYSHVEYSDYAYLLLKAALGISSFIAANHYLHQNDFFLESIAISAFIAMFWQQFQQFRIRTIRDINLTRLAAYISGLVLFLSLPSSAWGTATFINPSSINADSPIVNARLYWLITYGLQLSAILGFLITTHCYYQESLKKAIYTFFSWLIQTSYASNILFFLAQIALKYFDINDRDINTTLSNILLGTSAALAIMMTYLAPINDLRTFERYVEAATLTYYRSNTLSPIHQSTSIIGCLREIAQIILNIVIYTSSVMAATSQLQELLRLVYPELSNQNIIFYRNILSAALAFLGALHATLAAARRERSALPHLIYDLGNMLNKFCLTIIIGANSAYTFAFIYGIIAAIKDQPLHENIPTLPIIHIAAGAIAALALTQAIVVAEMLRYLIKVREPGFGMIVSTPHTSGVLAQAASLVRTPATSAPAPDESKATATTPLLATTQSRTSTPTSTAPKK